MNAAERFYVVGINVRGGAAMQGNRRKKVELPAAAHSLISLIAPVHFTVSSRRGSLKHETKRHGKNVQRLAFGDCLICTLHPEKEVHVLKCGTLSVGMKTSSL
jgi:hypothetical protein